MSRDKPDQTKISAILGSTTEPAKADLMEQCMSNPGGQAMSRERERELAEAVRRWMGATNDRDAWKSHDEVSAMCTEILDTTPQEVSATVAENRVQVLETELRLQEEETAYKQKLLIEQKAKLEAAERRIANLTDGIKNLMETGASQSRKIASLESQLAQQAKPVEALIDTAPGVYHAFACSREAMEWRDNQRKAAIYLPVKEWHYHPAAEGKDGN